MAEKIKIEKEGQEIKWMASSRVGNLDIKGKIEKIGGNYLTIKGEITIVFNERNVEYTFAEGDGIIEIESEGITSISPV